MNVASLELCKELYELSGWDTCRDWYMTNIDKPNDAIAIGSPRIHEHDRDYENGYRTDTPAYDLGYLLRKLNTLPIRIEHPYRESEHVNRWSAWYTPWDQGKSNYVEAADTPEDAVVMLAIELFKKDILRKEVI